MLLMYELPLFPLNTVLLPGTPIFLHIFEERYKEMIKDCLSEEKPFGVVLIDKGVEVFGTAHPHDIGCTAEIVNIERLDEGRMNLVALGRDRFTIHNTNLDKPFLQGNIENLPLDITLTTLKLRKTRERMRPLLEKYLGLLQNIAEVQIEWDNLPTDPIEFAYFAGYLLQIPSEQKQDILFANTDVDLLNCIQKMYQTEIAIVRTMVNRAKTKGFNPHDRISLN